MARSVNTAPDALVIEEGGLIDIFNKPGATNITPSGTYFIWYLLIGLALIFAVVYFARKKKM